LAEVKPIPAKFKLGLKIRERAFEFLLGLARYADLEERG
jgi:hypothetical protein